MVALIAGLQMKKNLKAVVRAGMLIALALQVCLFSNGRAEGQNATVPGEILLPYPTITCLAVEWLITGDDNQDAVVEVEYRMASGGLWKRGMPLLRVPRGDTGDRTRPTRVWRNKFSGSIFNLKPGTQYEIRLSLSDPDGGREVRMASVSTRPVPRPAADALIKKVNPRSFWDSLNTAKPGDILLLSPGYYKRWHRKIAIEVRGEPGRPIVIRADRSHEVIGSNFAELDLAFSKHLIIEGLTINGTVNLRFTEDVAVRHCTINAKFGIVAKRQPGCTNCYIADNVVSYHMPWVAEGIGSSNIWGGAANVGEGIEITGPGNVICHNRVSGYRDCISTMEDLWAYDQKCIDIYNNDIYNGPDDGIEADFCMSNCRIMRNRITNCGMGLSSQPGLGGPIYFIRNVMYNLAIAPFKLERLSYGNLFLHNTAVKAGDGLFEHHGQGAYFRSVFINNLAIGGSGGGQVGRYSSGEGLAVALPGYNETCTFGYNAVGTFGSPFAGLIGSSKFETIDRLNELTGGEGCLQVTMDVFAQKVDFPDPPFPARQPQDLRLAPGSPAVDAGLYIPGINDGYSGKAPDIGAYELGRDLPHYGPRPRGVDEETAWEGQN